MQDVKCWTAGLHQQHLVRPAWRSSSFILPSEKARSTLATTGRQMVERFPLTHMMADLTIYGGGIVSSPQATDMLLY